MSIGAENQAHGRTPAGTTPAVSPAGRHRLNGTGEAWTPPVPPRALRPATSAGHRHRLAGQPMDPPSAGSLPLAPPRPAPARQQWPVPLPQPRPSNRVPSQATDSETTSGFLPVQGSLPLPQPSPWPALPQPTPPEPPTRVQGSLTLPPAEPATAPAPAPDRNPAARRTKVTFTPAPARPTVPEEDEDTRVYLAEPLDGLGTFDLGSVPASVTPPKTWRKAAWFATGSSAAVVVGLLFAGSLLVGKPDEQSSQGAWPGYRGGSPLTSDEQQAGLPTAPNGGSAGKPAKGSHGNSTVEDDSSSRRGTPSDRSADPSTQSSGKGPVTTGTSGPPSSGPPQKPPVAPAERVTPSPAPPWYTNPPDAKTMGDNTEKFLNTVTTDPAAASAVTTGELHNEGPQALKERYADVAYFEVKKVTIDQSRGVTVNTVEVTRKDGTKTLEQKTLSFGDDDKIASDGQ